MAMWGRSVLAGALALAGGCSPVKGLPDGGGGDDDDDGGGASIDADLTPGRVIVRVFGDQAERRPGVRVVFQSPAGDVLAVRITGADGEADFDVPPGSAITVATTEETNNGGSEPRIEHNLQTVMGVRPGDVIEVGPRDPRGDVTPLGNLNVDFRTAFTGAVQYETRVGCASYVDFDIGMHTYLLYDNECTGGLEPVDLIATARGASYEPLAFSTFLGVSLDSPTYTPVTTWRTDFEHIGVLGSNAPSGMSFVQAGLGVFRRGLDYGLGEPEAAPVTPGSSAQADLLYPPSFADHIQPRLTAVWGPAATPNGISQFVRQLDPGVPAIELDLSVDLPPRVTNVTLDGDPANASINFATAASAGITFGATGVDWRIGDVASTTVWNWFVVFPAGQTSPLDLPTIPPNVLIDPTTSQDAWPPPGDAVLDELVLGMVRTTLDWDEVRQDHPFEFIDDGLPPDAPVGSEIALTAGGQFEM